MSISCSSHVPVDVSDYTGMFQKVSSESKCLVDFLYCSAFYTVGASYLRGFVIIASLP
jgi:hypothetical protein